MTPEATTIHRTQTEPMPHDPTAQGAVVVRAFAEFLAGTSMGEHVHISGPHSDVAKKTFEGFQKKVSVSALRVTPDGRVRRVRRRGEKPDPTTTASSSPADLLLATGIKSQEQLQGLLSKLSTQLKPKGTLACLVQTATLPFVEAQKSLHAHFRSVQIFPLCVAQAVIVQTEHYFDSPLDLEDGALDSRNAGTTSWVGVLASHERITSASFVSLTPHALLQPQHATPQAQPTLAQPTPSNKQPQPAQSTQEAAQEKGTEALNLETTRLEAQLQTLGQSCGLLQKECTDKDRMIQELLHRLDASAKQPQDILVHEKQALDEERESMRKTSLLWEILRQDLENEIKHLKTKLAGTSENKTTYGAQEAILTEDLRRSQEHVSNLQRELAVAREEAEQTLLQVRADHKHETGQLLANIASLEESLRVAETHRQSLYIAHEKIQHSAELQLLETKALEEKLALAEHNRLPASPTDHAHTVSELRREIAKLQAQKSEWKAQRTPINTTDPAWKNLGIEAKEKLERLIQLLG